MNSLVITGFSFLMFTRIMSTMSANLKELRSRLTSPYPFGGPVRFSVPDDKIDWNVDYPDYEQAPYYTSEYVLKNKQWADSESIADIKWNSIDGEINRKSYTGEYLIDKKGYPLNPVGRTGLRGRGNLGKWSTNHAVDPIVTRWKKVDGKTISGILQFVAIQRKDSGEWAIPGGMIDAGETAKEALIREFMEECFSIDDASEQEKEELHHAFDNLFQNHGVDIYKGYVDDRRNTDNSWIETVCRNFHTEDEHIINLPLKAGSDAKNAKWIDINSSLNLYASHKSFIEKVAHLHNAAW